MGDRLNESDVARILKVSDATVRQLIEEEVLSGTQSEDLWWTTEDLLLGDLAVLTETERIERFRDGNYTSPWAAGLKEGDAGYVSSKRIALILEGSETEPVRKT